MEASMQLLRQHPELALIFLALAVIEFVWLHLGRDRTYDAGAALASLGVAVGQAVLRPLGGVAIAAIMVALYEASPFALNAAKPSTWVIGFFAVEFTYYWFHRLSHQVRWLWATHAVHHSANQLVLPAAIRLGWTGFVSGGWLLFVALAYLGLPPIVVAGLLSFNLVYQFPLHTETIGRLGPLEWVLNTPSHHRAHHSSDAAWIDCNFGGVLIVFDRLFGTFKAEPVERGLRYGLVARLESRNPIVIALHEWVRMIKDMRAAGSFRAALALALGPPK